MDDAEGIASLSAELGYPASPIEMRQRLEALLGSSLHLILVARTPDDQVMGWCHLERRLSLEGGEKVEIMGLVVSASARRKGIGRALIAAGEDWALAQKLPIVVRSNSKRSESHPFYLELGYQLIKSQNVYGKIDRDH